MSRSLLLLVCLATLLRVSAQPGGYTPAQYGRLEAAAKLWGHIRYFHPALQYQNVNWDSAFAASVPRILAARTGTEYAQALQRWLNVLQDPVTQVLPPMPPVPQQALLFPYTEWRDSILIIRVPQLRAFSDANGVIDRLQEMIPLVEQAKGILFDLRPDDHQVGGDLSFDVLLNYSGIEPYLTDTTLLKPFFRQVVYEGFPAERNPAWDTYRAYFRINRTGSVEGKAKKRKPVVFLSNGHLPTPLIALALQDAGRGAVFYEGAEGQVQGSFVEHRMPDGIQVRVRAAELVLPSGQLPPPATVLSPAAVNLSERALSWIRFDSLRLKDTGVRMFPPIARTIDPAYPSGAYPDIGYRVLAAAKIYSVIDYFFPYKDKMDRDWDSAFHTFLPQFVGAGDSAVYALTVARFYQCIDDSHGTIGGPFTWRKLFYSGTQSSSVAAKIIEGKLVVHALINDSAAAKEGIGLGDVIERINGVPAGRLIDSIRSFVAASTFAAEGYWITRDLLCGYEGEQKQLLVRKANGSLRTIVLTCSAFFGNHRQKRRMQQDRPVFYRLTPQIGYADLGRLQGGDVDSMFRSFENTQAIIFDMRGYPNGTAWLIAPRLSAKDELPGARLSIPQPQTPHLQSLQVSPNDQSYRSLVATMTLPGKKRYTGKTLLLINEESISESEYTGMFFRAANGTRFVGSPTAGAIGNITNFYIPGDMNLYFSGMSIAHLSGEAVQRRGLQPDIYVVPTIRGIRANKDEVLHRALQLLLERK